MSILPRSPTTDHPTSTLREDRRTILRETSQDDSAAPQKVGDESTTGPDTSVDLDQTLDSTDDESVEPNPFCNVTEPVRTRFMESLETKKTDSAQETGKDASPGTSEDINPDSAPDVKEDSATVVTEDSAPDVTEDLAPVVKEESAPVLKEDSAPDVKEDSSPSLKKDLAFAVKEESSPGSRQNAAAKEYRIELDADKASHDLITGKLQDYN